MKRRLAVILVADVVGYSRLVEQDEESAVRALAVCRETVEALVENHDGRVFGSAGDSFIAEFQSPVEALRCALEVQDISGEKGEGENDNRVMQLRIGINLGDVIDEEGNLLGDGVNIAARLEQICDPGCITLSRSVYDQVRKVLDLDYEDLGERRVKNIEEPIQVYRIGPAQPAARKTVSEPNRADFDKPAIAVLPFDNISGDTEQEYFSDGITEDIITMLSHYKAFPVISRNSTFVYKGEAVKAQRVAEELGARYVIEGSIRKAGNRIRVAAQLIDAESGHHIWAEKFDRDLDDIFEVQDEISQKIVSIIQPELSQAELNRASSKRPDNLSAWDHVLKGMAHTHKHTVAHYQEARQEFQKAIDIDPTYSDAWSGLAWGYLAHLILKSPDEREEFLEPGLEAATRSVELDNRSYFAHYVLGVAYTWKAEYQRAISEVEISLELNPYFTQSLMGLGNRLDLSGRTHDGIQKMEEGLMMGPKDPFVPVYMTYLARANLSLGQPVIALDWIEKAIRIQPDNPDIQHRYAICLAHLDRVEDARAALQKCDRLDPDFLPGRKNWRPYSDEERNHRFFDGMVRHGLMPDTSA